MELKITKQKKEGQEEYTKMDLSKTWVSGYELINMGIEDVPMFWGRYFAKTGIAAFTGSSDCGKSTFLRQLALATVLEKTEFLGIPLEVEYPAAYYVATEDEMPSISSWLNKILNTNSGEDIDYNLKNLKFMCSSEDVIEKLDIALTELPASLVVIDAWADTYSGSVNNLVEVRANLNSYRELAIKHNCLVVMLHHTVKNSEKVAPDKAKLNGSGAIEHKVSSLIELRRGE